MKIKQLIILNIFFFKTIVGEIKIKPLIISIPKCGTHLLQKCIQLITQNEIIPRYSHLKYSKENEYNLRGFNKKFFIYRDPRDQLISLIYHAKKRVESYENNPKLFETIKSFLEYKNLSLEEIIPKLINEGSSYYDHYGIIDKPTMGILEFYNSYLPWKNIDNVCTVKFENLIGSQGGGNDNLQKNEIQKIANHLKINLNENEIKQIATNLFGNTNTFRQGKINSWKNYFKQQDKESFKKNAGNLLINLGYEKDLNW